MKAIRLSIAVLMALSLFLSSVATLAQAPIQEINQNSSQTPSLLVAGNWCFAGDLNGWNNSSTPMFDDGTNGDIIASDGIYSLVMSVPTAGTYAWKVVECGNWGNTHPAANSWVTTSAPMQGVTFTLDTIDYSLNAGMALLPSSNIVNVTGDNLPTSYTGLVISRVGTMPIPSL